MLVQKILIFHTARKKYRIPTHVWSQNPNHVISRTCHVLHCKGTTLYWNKETLRDNFAFLKLKNVEPQEKYNFIANFVGNLMF